MGLDRADGVVAQHPEAQTAPLDDVTRARLVRNAMAASGLEATPHASRARPSSAPVRWLAVAAVVVVLLAVGVAVLVRNDSGSSPTAML